MAYLGVPQSKLENLTTNVQIVNLGASFDGTTVTFNLQDSRGDAVYAVHERALLVTLGGVTQKPGVDYTTSGTTITFTTAPVSNLTIEIRKFYGVQRIIGVNDGVISPIKLSTGGPVWNSSGNVTISGDLNVTGSFNAGTNGLFWEDNERAKFGADNDLEIYHSGVNSFIRDSGTGSLFIEGTDLTLRAANSTTRYLEANASNGDVSLFFGNTKKFETTAQGISITGDINGAGNFILTSTNVGSTASPEIDLFRNSTSPADADYIGQIKFTGKQDGGGTVNYAKITGKILDASNGTEDGILEFMLRKAGSNNIAARFRSDSLQLLNGTSLTVAGNISLNDSSGSTDGRIILGTGDDLQIYHDGSNSFMLNSTGEFQISSGGSTLFIQAVTNENAVKVIPNAAVELYHDGSKKFETTATGAKITGALEVTQEYPTIRPTLDLNFAATKTLDRRITFTRDSLGTYVGEDGLVKYASNNVPRFDHDFDTRESLGLLIEESRTNKFTYSTTIGGTGWTQQGTAADYTTNTTEVAAPDGTFTALKWSPSAIPQYLYQNLSNIGTTQSTMSVWVRCPAGQSRTFFMNLYSPSQNGGAGQFTATDQWQRFTWTFTPQSQANVYPIVPDSAGVYYIWGPQLEVGAFATSYIPTSGSAVTRALDNAKITGTNFTDFYNQSEGTILSEHSIATGVVVGDNTYVYQVDDGSDTNVEFRLIDHNGAHGDVLRVYGFTGGSWNSPIYGSQTSTPDHDSFLKVAVGVKKDDFGVNFFGGTTYTDTSGDINVDMTQLTLGNHRGGTAPLQGHIKQFKYYPKRLPNAQLQGLTQQ